MGDVFPARGEQKGSNFSWAVYQRWAAGERESPRERKKLDNQKDAGEKQRSEVAVGNQKAHKAGLLQKLQKSLVGYMPVCPMSPLDISTITGLVPQNLKLQPRNTNHKFLYKFSVTKVRLGQDAAG